MRWFLLPCEAQDYLHSSTTPSSCVGYKPKFFPGLPTTSTQNQAINGIEARFETMNFHYCGCTPYRTEYTSRQAAAPSLSETSSNLDIEVVKKVRENIVTQLQIGDEKPPDTNNKAIVNGHSSDVGYFKDCEITIKSPIETLTTAPSTSLTTTPIERNEDSETCTLLCKAVPQRTLNMTNNNNSDGGVTKTTDFNLRFHNPPKEIFKPTVEVGGIIIMVFVYPNL